MLWGLENQNEPSEQPPSPSSVQAEVVGFECRPFSLLPSIYLRGGRGLPQSVPKPRDIRTQTVLHKQPGMQKGHFYKKTDTVSLMWGNTGILS